MSVGVKSLASREHRTAPGENSEGIKNVLEARERRMLQEKARA